MCQSTLAVALQASIILINHMVSIDQRAYLAEALLDFIHKNGGADAQLYLPAVAVLPKVTQGQTCVSFSARCCVQS